MRFGTIVSVDMLLVDDYGNSSSLPQRGSARASNVRGGQRRPINSSTTRGSSRQRQRAMDMDMSGDIFPTAEAKGADGIRAENVFCCRNWIHHGTFVASTVELICVA